MKDLMLDLFAGTGSASAPFRRVGWEVVRVELDPQFPAEFHADVRDWIWTGRRPTLVWASPPCTEFARESMPWSRTGKTPSLELVEAAERVIRECDPQFWVIENVKGASRHLRKKHGQPLCLGPIRLWGKFPWFTARVPPFKERLSSRQKKERARIPFAVADGLRRSIMGDLFYHQTTPAASALSPRHATPASPPATGRESS